jgi:hypothetical protein
LIIGGAKMDAKKYLLWLFIVFIGLTGCESNSESNNDNLFFLETRRDTHNYEESGFAIGDYDVLEKTHNEVICQSEVLSTVYYSKSGEYFSFTETECTPDPTYYVYHEYQYLTLNEAESIGVLLDEDIVEFCKEHVLITLQIDND